MKKKGIKRRKRASFKVSSVGPFLLALFIVIAVIAAAFLAVAFSIIEIPLMDDRLIFCAAVVLLLTVVLAFALTAISDSRRTAANGEALEAIISEAERVLNEEHEITPPTATAPPENKNEGHAKKRFPRLCAMDGTEKETVISEKETTLSALCDDFRNYAAYEKGLYYDKKTVRAFVSGLSVSHLMIIQGMSGTGKTSLACAFGDFLKRPAALIPVQPSWKEKTDLIGYYNEFTGIYNETELLATLYGAGRTDSVCITVLDEMNIARVEYYFAEFLSVLEMPEAKRRIIGITPSGMDGDPEGMTDGRLLLPENVWYIGTANNDDSTVAISDKVYDRASVITLDKRAFPFDAKRTEPRKLSYNELEGLFEGARRRYGLTLRSRRRIEKLDEYLSENFGISFGNRIMHQLERLVPVYVACGGDELEAVDTVLAGKVLRKLGSKNPVFVRNSVSSLYGMLDELFGEGSMPSCRAALSVYGKNS